MNKPKVVKTLSSYHGAKPYKAPYVPIFLRKEPDDEYPCEGPRIIFFRSPDPENEGEYLVWKATYRINEHGFGDTWVLTQATVDQGTAREIGLRRK